MSFFKPYGSGGAVPGIAPGGTGHSARSGPGTVPYGSIIDSSVNHQSASARAFGVRRARASKTSDARAREGSGPSASRPENGRSRPDSSVFDSWPVKPWEPDPPPVRPPSAALRRRRNEHLRRNLAAPELLPIPRDTWIDSPLPDPDPKFCKGGR